MNRTEFSLLTIALLLAGCTYEPGSPWGYLDAELQIDPVSDSGDVEVISQSITLDEMQLRAPAEAAAGAQDFDPSDPPPEFTLCHQDHCHHEDGYTVSYDDIAAGVGFESGGQITAARRKLETSLGLNQGADQEVEFRLVDQVSINEAALTIDQLYIEAQLENGGEVYDLQITLAMATRPFRTGISYRIGRDSPERQRAELEIDWPDSLFAELEHLDGAVESASDNTIVVHGTSNHQLRNELVDRIHDDTSFRWIEDESEDS